MSLCVRSKVGAIITGPEGRHIVGEGYNGPPSGYRHNSNPCSIWCQRASPRPAGEDDALSPEYDDCPSLHAEANALMRSDHTRRQGGTIYVTSHVCFGCSKLIANSGLARVVVDTDKADMHRNPLASYQFLIQCGIAVSLSDLVMQSRLFDATVEFVPSLGHGVMRNPPLFPGEFMAQLIDNANRFNGTPSDYAAQASKVAKERSERQDPRG